MANVFTDGAHPGPLSPQATQLYGAIAGQEWELVDALTAEHPEARAELVSWGLISDEERPVSRDPQYALRAMVTRELQEARRRVDLVLTMPELSRDLIREYRQVQLRAGGGSSVYLPDAETVNARLQDVVGGARREILAAQPGGPRQRELLEIAVARDAAALDRGVDMRTIYRDTVRDHKVTAEYARAMSSRARRPARYRTVPGAFERMVIVDRETAFVSDHVVEGAPPHAAWMVTDPAVVAVLARVFESEWTRAEPWAGELRTTWGGLDRAPVGADGVRTNRLEREVMRLLCAGASQNQAAGKVGLSKRKLECVIAGLKDLWGVRTLNELIFQYALSPDRLVDDSDPSTPGAGGPCPSGDTAGA